jgi:hypothetical protein
MKIRKDFFVIQILPNIYRHNLFTMAVFGLFAR